MYLWGVCPPPGCRPHLKADPPWRQTPDADPPWKHPPYPWIEGMTQASENIILPQTSFAGGNEILRGKQWRVYVKAQAQSCAKSVADLHRQTLEAHPLSRSNFLHFHAVFRKNWPSNRLASPFWAGCPLGNPGFATANDLQFVPRKTPSKPTPIQSLILNIIIFYK